MNHPTRDMTERDRAFVASTWANAARYCGGIPKEARTGLSYRTVNALLARGPRVLCIATDERTVHAWAAGKDGALLFAYTAPELRRNGFARYLIRALFGARGPSIIAHDAPDGLVPGAHYNPHLLALMLSEPPMLKEAA